MKEVEKVKNPEIYLELRNILRIANKAANKAKLENSKFGIAKIFARNQILYFEYQNGTISTKRPKSLEKH